MTPRSHWVDGYADIPRDRSFWRLTRERTVSSKTAPSDGVRVVTGNHNSLPGKRPLRWLKDSGIANFRLAVVDAAVSTQQTTRPE